MNENDEVVGDAYALMAICEWDEYHEQGGRLWCYNRSEERYVCYEWSYTDMAYRFVGYGNPPDEARLMSVYEREEEWL